jgi:hypothetical protein
MEKTKNYNMFKTVKGGNRKLHEKHVEDLMLSISKENLLECSPILVNEEFEVIDGQHRLEAAKRLDLPIYYIQKDQIGSQQISTLNSYRRDWKMSDYLDFYANSLQYPEYVKLKKLAEANNLHPTETLGFFMGNSADSFYSEFSKGNFRYKDSAVELIEFYKSYLDKVKMFYHKSPAVWHTQSFVRAFSYVISNPEINPSKFLEQVDKFGFLMDRRNGRKAYIELLLEMYNYRRRNPVEI